MAIGEVTGAWPDSRFAALLGSRLPIVAAPMAGAGGVDLAASVMEGGAVGSLPCALLEADTVVAQAAQVRQRSTGPLNLNFFCHMLPEDADDTAWRQLLQPLYAEFGIDPPPAGGALRRPFDASSCAAVEAVRPEIVSFHFGLPDDPLLDRVRRTGARILVTATSLAEARALDARGVDAIIAQGWEAGGHIGRFLPAHHGEQMGLFALLPQIVDAVSVPVIAAGGIADGRGIAAALMLGAAAVQIGTAFLRCPESLATPAHREALATVAAEHTQFTNLFTGGLARGLPTRLTETLGAVRGEAPPFPLASPALASLAARDPAGFRPMWAGQSARLAPVLPARDLVTKLADDARARLPARG